MIECPLCSCLFIVGYRHIQHFFMVCLQCFTTIRQLNLQKHYARFSLLTQQIQEQARAANGRLRSFVCEQVGSLKELLKRNTLENYFLIKEYSECSAKLSLSTTQDSDTNRDFNGEGPVPLKQNPISERCSEVVNDLIGKIQPTKQLFRQKAEGLLQSASTVKQKYQNVRSECRSLAAEMPSMRSIKKGLNGFFKFF